MKTKIIIIAIISLMSVNIAFTQADSNLSLVYLQADLTEKLLKKYDYSPVNRDLKPGTIDTAKFELKVTSGIMGEYIIKGKIIMQVKKINNLSDYNNQKVKEEQILLVLNEKEKEYFMVHLYFIDGGNVKPEWFRYLFSEAHLMYDSLKELVQ